MYTMKKHLITMCFCLAGVCSLPAQESPKVAPSEPLLSDVCNALATLDIHLFRFDLAAFLSATYTIGLYIDEYENGHRSRRVRTIWLGKNRLSLNDIPEEERDEARRSGRVAEGESEWVNLRELSLYITKPNDSVATFTAAQAPNGAKAWQNVKLRAVEGTSRIYYQVRPFSLDPVPAAVPMNVPLLLYGSAWLDRERNVMRFCGERCIDPAMQAQLLDRLPHYYVIGLEFEKTDAADRGGK